MPRSKHRRKPGGKAVAHPGRGKTRELPLSPTPRSPSCRTGNSGGRRRHDHRTGRASGAADSLPLPGSNIPTGYRPPAGAARAGAGARGVNRRRPCPLRSPRQPWRAIWRARCTFPWPPTRRTLWRAAWPGLGRTFMRATLRVFPECSRAEKHSPELIEPRPGQLGPAHRRKEGASNKKRLAELA